VVAIVTLIDERDALALRNLIGRLLSSAGQADIALSHLRLSGIDLDESEFTVAKCRLMIGHFNASQVASAHQSGMLARIAESGRLEMRTAPHQVWNPDFSVFRGMDAGPDVLLVGAHYFGRPYPMFGVALTAVTTEPTDVHLAGVRFEQIWNAGYDVLPVIRDALHRG